MAAGMAATQREHRHHADLQARARPARAARLDQQHRLGDDQRDHQQHEQAVDDPDDRPDSGVGSILVVPVMIRNEPDDTSTESERRRRSPSDAQRLLLRTLKNGEFDACCGRGFATSAEPRLASRCVAHHMPDGTPLPPRRAELTQSSRPFKTIVAEM